MLTTPIFIDPNNLAGWYQSFFGGRGTGVAPLNTGTATTGVNTTTAATAKYAPTPPWQGGQQPSASKLVQTAIHGGNIVNPNAAQLDLPGAGVVYKNLFALYQGLDTLYNVADQASASSVSSFQLSQLSSAFAGGLAQVQKFVAETNFGALRVTTGTTAANETATATAPAQANAYQTVALNTTGDSSAVVPAFQGNVQFDVNVRAGSSNTTIHMNLDDMGSTPRTMANVVAYLNSQMQAGGAIANFSVNAMAATPDVINVGGKNVTVSSGLRTWGLQLNTDPFETVTLTAPQTAPAVYIGQVVGAPSATTGAGAGTSAAQPQSQLLKFQVGGAATPPAPPAHAAPDQIFTDNLGQAVNSI
jgi:hypothetical protein